MLGSIFVSDSFPVQSQSGHILIDNANGEGAIFAFGAKSRLTSAKQVVLWILCMAMGGDIAPLPPPPLATLVTT